MQAVDDKIETIHLYVVREDDKKPSSAVPLFLAFLCLVALAVVMWYSAEHPYYEHERLTLPAQFLPLKVFKAEVPIIPTGIRTYPATFAHGYLTFSNGSIIGQDVPAGFTIDNVSTDYAIYVPPATPDGFGVARVAAHLLIAGINLSTLVINEVIGSSLFIRNLSPFTGGHPAYSMIYQQPKDRLTALSLARSSVAAQEAHIAAFLAEPCKEDYDADSGKLIVTWNCQFVTYRIPAYMHVSAAKLVGTSFIVDVLFVPPMKPMQFR